MVKLRSDQERVKALLKETITLLCKNGLEYKSRFCVDALIGITLDEDDVFLVKITETVNDRGLGNNSNGNPAPLNFSTHSPIVATHPQMPPMVTLPQSTPSHDVQVMQESLLSAQANSSPQVSTATPTSVQRKSPVPRKQATPQQATPQQAPQQATPQQATPQQATPQQATPQPLSLTHNRKRRASSSPVRLIIDQPSPEPERPAIDIPDQHVATPGAISNASELSNQSAPSQEPTPIMVEPTSPDVEEAEDFHVKFFKHESQTISDAENEPALQDVPLNMSKASQDKDDEGCSGWDPANIQQQVAQIAAATLSQKSPGDVTKCESPGPDGSTPPTEQDVSWSLLKSALKTKQKGGRQPSEDNMGYYYALSNPQYQLEKRYVCDFAGCNYTSSRKYNLMRHGRTHHEDQRIPCPECPGTFVDKYILKEHMAAAHPKFTIPIEGTNMIGVGIGDTNVPGEPGTKRKRSSNAAGTPGSSPGMRRAATPKAGKESPQSKRRSGGWHIPRLVPMGDGEKEKVKDGDTVEGAELKLNVEPFLNESGDSNSLMDTSMGDRANNNTSKSAYEPVSAGFNEQVSAGFSLASMQAVFPGMDMLSIAKDPDMSNNNTPKVQDEQSKPTDLSSSMQAVFPGLDMSVAKEKSQEEEQSAPTDLSSGMQVMFPGMEMEDSNGAGDAESDTSAVKDRSLIETSDGEEAKVSE